MRYDRSLVPSSPSHLILFPSLPTVAPLREWHESEDAKHRNEHGSDESGGTRVTHCHFGLGTLSSLPPTYASLGSCLPRSTSLHSLPLPLVTRSSVTRSSVTRSSYRCARRLEWGKERNETASSGGEENGRWTANRRNRPWTTGERTYRILHSNSLYVPFHINSLSFLFVVMWERNVKWIKNPKKSGFIIK